MSRIDGAHRLPGIPLEAAHRPEMSVLASAAGVFLDRFCAARSSYGLTADELILLLAVGRLSLGLGLPVRAMRPVSYVELAEHLALPRETVRRKTVRLTDRQFLIKVTHGVLLRDPDRWSGIAGQILGLDGVIEKTL